MVQSRVLSTVLISLILPAAVIAIPAPAQSARLIRTCWVKNTTQNDPPRSSLQRAINDPRRGDRLAIKGQCKGSFRIDKNLRLVGRTENDRYSRPTMHGKAYGSTLTVRGQDTRVLLVDLRITGGRNWGESGGGIANFGKVELLGYTRVVGNGAGSGGGIGNRAGARLVVGNRAVIARNTADFGGGIHTYKADTFIRGGTVRANDASYGGGIFQSSGRLRLFGGSTVGANIALSRGGGFFTQARAHTMLLDHSSVQRNKAGIGGGIWHEGARFFVGKHATIRLNSAKGDGGGVYSRDDFLMQGSARVAGNTAGDNGAGVFNKGNAELAGSAVLTGNVAGIAGGGVYNSGGLIVGGDVTIAGNDPDDCVGC